MDKKETYSQEVVRMYADEYVPAVHRIGRFTTALAFIVSFLGTVLERSNSFSVVHSAIKVTFRIKASPNAKVLK